MKVSFKKLFKLLIDREMKKSELAAAANLSAADSVSGLRPIGEILELAEKYR